MDHCCVRTTLASTPSLGRSDHSSADDASIPATPLVMSPYINVQPYSLPPIDAISIPQQSEATYRSRNTTLPEILDPNSAASIRVRNICCIGAGYVGGPTAAVIALHNPGVRVTVVDRDQRRVDAWNSKHLPIHEPGLTEVVRIARDGTGERPKASTNPSSVATFTKSGRKQNLYFSTACAEAIADADMIFISVNTPTKSQGIGAGRAADMTALEGAVEDIAVHARGGAIIVEKSTVPCKTGQLIKDILEARRPGQTFPVLSNPEFLSEGTAIRDLMEPERVVIGCESTIPGHRAAAALANLYAAWVPRFKIAPINIWSSELCKLAGNAMLAQRISSINSISAICERTGADVNDIAKTIGMDTRIGPKFLKAGLGFGGSCFRKDIASLTYLAESLGLPEVAVYWQQVLNINDFQRDRFVRLVISSLNNTLRGKKITILGYAFKKNTGDARESPALDVIRLLLAESPRSISIFDPLCTETDIRSELCSLDDGSCAIPRKAVIEILQDPYAACAESNAILVLTDWDMFQNNASNPPTEPSHEQHAFDRVTPAAFLKLQSEIKSVQAPTSMPPTPPDTPCITLSSPSLSEQLVPEPACPTNCSECETAADVASKKSNINHTLLDWSLISRSMREPKWVFDGRGILDATIMAHLGFRLETLGRASMY